MGRLIDDLPDAGAELVDYAGDTLKAHLAFENKRLREDPMTYGLPPNEAQEHLHMSTSDHILWVAANRVGKTTAGVRECLWRARGNHPYKNLRRHHNIVIGVVDFTFFEETLLPIMLEWLPRSWVVDESRKHKRWVIRHVDGGTCIIQVKTHEQGRKSWQGFEADFIWMDEEHPEDIYKEAFARLITARGTMLQTFTPVGGLGWTYDRIYLPGKNGSKPVHVIEAALAEYRPECHCGHDPDTHDETTGCKLCRCGRYDIERPLAIGRILVSHMSYDDVLRFASQYPDEDERAIRIFGQYRARTGAVFKMLRPEIHVVPAFEIPDHWFVWGGVDPGFNGFAATFKAQSPHERIYNVGEYFSQHEDTATRLAGMAKVLREIRQPKLAQAEPNPYEALVYRTAGHEPPEDEDPFGDPERDVCVMFVDTEDPQTVVELNLEAAKQGAPFVFAALEQGLKAVKAGVLRMQQLLTPDADRPRPAEVTRDLPSGIVGEPQHYFFDSLQSTWREGEELIKGRSRLLWEMERLRWKKPPTGKKVPPDELDKESAGGAHMTDADRYATMARLGAPEEKPKPKRQHLNPIDRAVWDEVEALEQSMMEEEPF